MTNPRSEEPGESRIKQFFTEPGKIPCLRRSFLTGIAGGIGAGVGYFFMTSNVRRATHVGVGGYFFVTMGTWIYCRYKFAKEKITQRQIKKVLQSKILLEGTEIEAVSNKKNDL